MIYRTQLFALVIFGLGLIISSCRSIEPVPVVVVENTELISEEVQEQIESVRPPVQQDSSDLPVRPGPYNTQAMTQELTNFSFDLFSNLSNQYPQQNFSFSPVSLNMALAVIYSGAMADTRNEIADLMGFEKDAEIFHTNWFHYFSGFARLETDTLLDFNLANRVFVEQTYPVLDSYRRDVQTFHGGAFEQMDFISNAGQAEQRINAWAEEMTRQRIKDLIPQGTLDHMTRMVLANAIYIKSDWRHPFEEENNIQKEFHAINGRIETAEFMTQRESRIPYLQLDDRKVIQLPYTSPHLSLMIILPEEKAVKDISTYIPDAEQYKEIIDNLRREDVYMEIPKFKLESQFSLSDHLKEMGMEKAFDSRADFSGIGGQRDLFISAILQKVFFEIDEKGSEAAAATAIIVTTTALMPGFEEPKEFIADRPFIFILKENQFNTPLFVGQFVNP
ncbi:MAG: serpin family protein [Bacteroidales bacterium]|nr:serpin family protein [Bacteroidales bacterium]